MTKTTKPKSRVTHGVSWEPDVIREAKKRARVRRQSLSAYINELVVRDKVANFEHNGAPKAA